MKKDKIFIQIASYRDPQLLPTLRDCIEKAKYPENLIFAITWQHAESDKWDNLDEFKGDPRFKVVDIKANESKGTCWARNTLQTFYDDEEYTLQLDSHHRFAPDWDVTCIEMFKQLQELGHEKPLLTAYIPSFDPDNDPAARVTVPWKMNFDRFIPEGAVFFIPAAIDNYKELDHPLPARFYSAHFAFTTGKFVMEVPHDPQYYFHGEEISIAARAYTWGYDLFHPHKVVAWHEYTRKGRTKHWDDHKTWASINNESHLRNRKLFQMDGLTREGIDFGIYDFGTVRTLRDYEKYAGISFAKRGVTQYTLDYKNPPNPELSDEDFDNSILKIFKHCIDFTTDKVPEPIDDYDFWVVAFENKKGDTIYRQDVDTNELQRLKHQVKVDGYYKIWRTFNVEEKPARWIVWTHSKANGWGNREVGEL